MSAGLLAFLLTVAPLALGVGIGPRLRHRALLLLPIPLTIGGAVLLRVGVWDGVFVGAAFLLGAWWSGLRREGRRSRTVLVLISGGLAFVIAEGIARSQRTMMPGLPPQEIQTLVLPHATTPDLHSSAVRDQWPPNAACAMLFPSIYPEVFEARAAVRQRRSNTILHVGDSMVVGWGVPPDRAFPALLQARDTANDHVNGALHNTTIDFESLLIERWTQRLTTDLVVLYPYAGSDLVEMDEAFPCCGDGPLLTYENGAARPRCTTPDFTADDRSFSWILAHSPAPEPLRAAAAWSELARLAVLEFRHDLRVDQPPDVQWQHYEDALRSLRDALAARRIPLLVVVLPSKRGLETDPPADSDPAHRSGNPREVAHALAALSRGLSIDTIDASSFLRGLVRDGGSDRWFVSDQIHFSIEAHERFAQWLQPQLEQRLSGQRSAKQ